MLCQLLFFTLYPVFIGGFTYSSTFCLQWEHSGTARTVHLKSCSHVFQVFENNTVFSTFKFN